MICINSQSVQATVIFDLGRNQRNINKFLSEFDQQKSKYNLSEIDNLNDIQDNLLDVSKTFKYAEEVYDNQNLLIGILSGLAAGLAALFIWYIFAGIIMKGGYGWSLGIPFIVGFAIRYGGKGITNEYKMAGGILSLLFCIAGRFISICYLHIEGQEIMILSFLFEMTTESFFEIMTAYFLSSDILFIYLLLQWAM